MKLLNMRNLTLGITSGIILVLILSGFYFLREPSKEPILDQLTRVDVEAEKLKNVDVIFSGNEEISELIELFRKIDWEDGEPKMAREPNLTLHLFFNVEEGMPETIRPYDVWFNSQSVTFVDSHNVRIGMLKGKDATKLQELVNEKIESVRGE